MKITYQFKKKATRLRQNGLSYSEIQEKIPVSRSTLSLWLRNIELTKSQKTRLKNKTIKSLSLGSKAIKRKRIRKHNKIVNRAKAKIKNIGKDELFLIGTSLYWAEGSKQKKHNPSQRAVFSNSDPLMIKVYLKWLKKCLNIKSDEILFEIYSHGNLRQHEKKMIKYWSNITNFPLDCFDKIYYKKDKNNQYRKNKKRNYYGLLRIKIRKSTDLNRKITGWIEGVCMQCGVV